MSGIRSDKKNSVEQKINGFFNSTFGRWGEIVAVHPCKIFWMAFLLMFCLSAGMAKHSKFEDMRLAWTPEGAPSIESNEKATEMFPSTGGFISVLYEANDNIITADSFAEMAEFQSLMYYTKIEINSTVSFDYTDICVTAGPTSTCVHGERALSFIENS